MERAIKDKAKIAAVPKWTSIVQGICGFLVIMCGVVLVVYNPTEQWKPLPYQFKSVGYGFWGSAILIAVALLRLCYNEDKVYVHAVASVTSLVAAIFMAALSSFVIAMERTEGTALGYDLENDCRYRPSYGNSLQECVAEKLKLAAEARFIVAVATCMCAISVIAIPVSLHATILAITSVCWRRKNGPKNGNQNKLSMGIVRVIARLTGREVAEYEGKKNTHPTAKIDTAVIAGPSHQNKLMAFTWVYLVQGICGLLAVACGVTLIFIKPSEELTNLAYNYERLANVGYGIWGGVTLTLIAVYGFLHREGRTGKVPSYVVVFLVSFGLAVMLMAVASSGISKTRSDRYSDADHCSTTQKWNSLWMENGEWRGHPCCFDRCHGGYYSSFDSAAVSSETENDIDNFASEFCEELRDHFDQLLNADRPECLEKLKVLWSANLAVYSCLCAISIISVLTVIYGAYFLSSGSAGGTESCDKQQPGISIVPVGPAPPPDTIVNLKGVINPTLAFPENDRESEAIDG